MRTQLNDLEMWELKTAFRENDIHMPIGGKWNLSELLKFNPNTLSKFNGIASSILIYYETNEWVVCYEKCYETSSTVLVTALEKMYKTILNDNENIVDLKEHFNQFM